MATRCRQVRVPIAFFHPAMPRSTYTQPLPLPAAGWRRRLEVFSPKLVRRLSLGSYDAWRCWIALEANPQVTSFCERPSRMAGRTSAMIDFWVQLCGTVAAEFWLLWNPRVDAVTPDASPEASATPAPKRLHDHPVRLITPEIIASWEVPVASWAQIVPVLVSYRRYRKPLLEQSIVVQLAQYVALDDLINHFDHDDPDEVVASLYWLLALGRVRSPDLATERLNGASRFRRV